MSGLSWRWLGRRPYLPTLDAQRRHRDALRSGDATEQIWLLEHDAVITTGRRPVPDLDLEGLARRSIPVTATERGGLATWHGPGQLVAYVLVRAAARGLGARTLVDALQSAVIAWLDDQGLQAGPRQGLPGVWVGQDKICAVGLNLSGGVSMHGIALNLDPDLDVFQLFTPCGVPASRGGVTSVARLAGSAPAPREAASELGPRLAAAIRRSSSRSALDATGAPY